MADVGKVTPGNPVIPPVPKDRPVDERDEKKRQQDEEREQQKKDGDEPGEDKDGIDVYV